MLKSRSKYFKSSFLSGYYYQFFMDVKERILLMMSRQIMMFQPRQNLLVNSCVTRLNSCYILKKKKFFQNVGEVRNCRRQIFAQFFFSGLNGVLIFRLIVILSMLKGDFFLSKKSGNFDVLHSSATSRFAASCKSLNMLVIFS